MGSWARKTRKDSPVYISFCSFASSLHSGAACLNLPPFDVFLIKKIGKRSLGPGSALGEKGENNTRSNRKNIGERRVPSGSLGWRKGHVASSFRIPSSASVVPAFHPSSQERVKRWLPSSKMAGSFPNLFFLS